MDLASPSLDAKNQRGFHDNQAVSESSHGSAYWTQNGAIGFVALGDSRPIPASAKPRYRPPGAIWLEQRLRSLVRLSGPANIGVATREFWRF